MIAASAGEIADLSSSGKSDLQGLNAALDTGPDAPRLGTELIVDDDEDNRDGVDSTLAGAVVSVLAIFGIAAADVPSIELPPYFGFGFSAAGAAPESRSFDAATGVAGDSARGGGVDSRDDVRVVAAATGATTTADSRDDD